MRKIVLTVLAFLVLISQGFAETKTVRFSYSTGWDAIPAVVAIEKGFLAEQGLVVDGLALSSGQTILESLTNGTTDFATVPNRTLILVTALKLPLKVVAVSGWGVETEMIVPADAKAGSLKDLKGKTIGLGVSSEAFPLFIRYVEQSGLKWNDFTIKNLDSGQLLKALDAVACKEVVLRPTKEGQSVNICADAIIASRHFTARLVGSGKAKVLVGFSDVAKAVGGRNTSVILSRNTLIETDPQTVQKFVNGWVKALRHIEKEPAEAASLMQVFFSRQGTQVPKDLAELWVKIEKFDRAAWTQKDTEDTVANARALQQVGVLKAMPDIPKFIDVRFTDKAPDQKR